MTRWPLDSSDGPATPTTPESAEALVSAAMRSVARKPRRPRRVVWAVALAAALTLVLGSALAAVLPRIFRTPPPVPAEHPPVAIVPPMDTVATTPAVTAVEPTPPPVETAPSSVVTPKDVPPADLLRMANSQRKERRWSEAAATYERVMTRSPHGDEAYAATLAAASIRLEHLGDAKGALRLYRAALAERPSGALAEEAQWGIAEAERVLGDRPAEIDALRAFIAAHRDGVMRPSADQRLRELKSSM